MAEWAKANCAERLVIFFMKAIEIHFFADCSFRRISLVKINLKAQLLIVKIKELSSNCFRYSQ